MNFNRVNLLIISLSLFSLNLQAQQKRAPSQENKLVTSANLPKYSFDIHLTYPKITEHTKVKQSFDSVDKTTDDAFASGLGFGLGMGFNYRFNNSWGLHGALTYDKYRIEGDSERNGVTLGRIRHDLKTIALDIMPQYTLQVDETFFLNFMAGVRYGRVVGVKDFAADSDTGTGGYLVTKDNVLPNQFFAVGAVNLEIFPEFGSKKEYYPHGIFAEFMYLYQFGSVFDEDQVGKDIEDRLPGVNVDFRGVESTMRGYIIKLGYVYRFDSF